MKIAIDVDEVVDNLMESVLTVYNARHNTSYSLTDCTNFDLYKNFPTDVAHEMFSLFGDHAVQNILQIVDGARWGVEKLMQEGHKIYFATATIPSNFNWKVEWLLRNLPTINRTQIIAIYDKGLLNVDILIDDNLDNLKAGIYERICFDWPWNQTIRDDVYDIYRCKSWYEIIDVIDQIERKNEKSYE